MVLSRTIASVLLALALSASAHGEVRIKISATPELPVKNLAGNPGFEEGGEMPSQWPYSERAAYFYASREPWRVKMERIPEGGHHGAYLRVDVLTTSVLSELFVRQPVAVEPDTLYRMGVFARIRSGLAIIHMLNEDRYAYTAKSETKASWRGTPLYPDFVPVEWLAGPAPDEWVWIEQEVRSKKDEHKLYFGVGSYYERASVDFDDAFFGLARTDLTLEVKAASLQAIEVKNDEGKVCWQSGVLPAGTDSIRHTVPGLSTARRYAVTVTAAGQPPVSQWYPSAP
ncbi:hypothetical protein BH09VER1_BH09VER1_07740 [soil metagenome]